MDKEPILALWLIGLVFISGCLPVYQYSQRADGGYIIKKCSDSFPEFTVDSENQYPQDLTVAKKRFKRRGKFVEDWYKKHEPEDITNPYIASLKMFAGLPLKPFKLVLAVLTKEPPEETEEEAKAARRVYAEARKEMEAYIAQDCEKEELAGQSFEGGDIKIKKLGKKINIVCFPPHTFPSMLQLCLWNVRNTLLRLHYW